MMDIPATSKARPRHNEDYVIKGACRLLAPAVMEWLQDEPCSEEEVIDDLAKAAGWDYHDGYAVARNLERHCSWSPDSELVEILDGLTFRVHDQHTKAVEAWVAAGGGGKPLFAIGDRVSIRRGLGKVVGIRPEQAVYVIRCDGETGEGGWIIPFEDVSLPEEIAA